MICDNEQPNYDVDYGWSNYLGMHILHTSYVDVIWHKTLSYITYIGKKSPKFDFSNHFSMSVKEQLLLSKVSKKILKEFVFLKLGLIFDQTYSIKKVFCWTIVFEKNIYILLATQKLLCKFVAQTITLKLSMMNYIYVCTYMYAQYFSVWTPKYQRKHFTQTNSSSIFLVFWSA